jgi:hypothetical protein
MQTTKKATRCLLEPLTCSLALGKLQKPRRAVYGAVSISLIQVNVQKFIWRNRATPERQQSC